MKPFRNLIFIFILLVSIIFNGCTPKNNNSFIISGSISNLETDYIILSQIENIQTKKKATNRYLKSKGYVLE